jgi:hypothetical protein
MKNFTTPQPCFESFYCPEGSVEPTGAGDCPPGSVNSQFIYLILNFLFQYVGFTAHLVLNWLALQVI